MSKSFEWYVFVKWIGEDALFTKASLSDKILDTFGLFALCRLLNIEDGNKILIKIPISLKLKQAKQK